MTNKNNNNTFNRKAILLFLTLSLMLSACQTTTPNQAVVTETASPTLPSPTATSLPSPTPTPTPGPLKLNLSQELPAEMFASIPTPLGMVLSDDPEEADIVVEVASDGQKYELISYQVYTLVAPFFTVQDNITLKELTAILTGMSSQEEAPFKGVYAKEPFSQLQSLIDPKNPKRVTLATTTDLSVIPEEYWMIVPFEELQPEFKVISIDGISPLDDNFDPSEYSLSLPVGVRLNATDREIDPALLSSLLPESNYKLGQLTSLIMTGVTAMARDTAFVMSTEGVLYPGTNIRKVMRAADLTHISNEVSFFEDCPLPDPDYEGFIFCSDPEYIDLLADLGTDIVELTGNHNNDVRAIYKVDSVPYSLDLYRKNDMQWYAGGTNLTNAKAPLKIEHNGNKLAFVGCNSYGPYMAWATDDSSGSAPCEDWEWIKQSVAALKLEGYLPIVTLQFQEEYLYTATSLAIRDFRPLAEAGAVIVNGSQSHVGKALEFYSDALIQYGLGNLFFDQPGFYITYDGFIQKHFFYQGRHISTQLLTITLEDTAKPRFMTDDERAKFLQDIFDSSAELRSTP
ncbi:MAG: CapA family protein [Anaerolineaceae bacterium]